MTSNGRVHVLLLMMSIVLGTQFPASKIAVDASDPMSVTAFRMGIGAAVGIATIAVRGEWNARVLRNPHTWALGALLALVYVLLNTGIERTTASKTALLLNTSVVLLAIFMVAFFREPVTFSKTAGIVSSMGGVVVLTTRLDTGFLAGGEALGDILVFLAGLTWTIFVLVAKRTVDREEVDSWNLAGSVLSISAAIAFVPIFFWGWSLPASSSGWVALVYLGLIPTLLPLWLLLYSLRTVSPTISALLILPAVFVAAILSFALLRDPLGVPTLAGGGLVLGGAYVATRTAGLRDRS